jgi:hypothetical protein
MYKEKERFMADTDNMRDTEFLPHLRLLDYDMLADEVSSTLGVLPTHTYTKGEPILSGGVYRRNMWCK